MSEGVKIPPGPKTMPPVALEGVTVSEIVVSSIGVVGVSRATSSGKPPVD